MVDLRSIQLEAISYQFVSLKVKGGYEGTLLNN